MATTYMSRSFTAGDRDKWTFSAWVKRGTLGLAPGALISAWADGSNYSGVWFDGSDRLKLGNLVSGGWQGQLITTRKFRDMGAWYHFVAVWDSGNASAGDRMRLYVNGVEETAFDTDDNPSADQDSWFNTTSSSSSCRIGFVDSNYWDGCMSHVQFVDGSALAPTEFGQTDATSGIWTIKTSPYATPGTNGFCLKMEDRTNLDLDSSSNALTFTTTGTATATHDNPSNNFATFNPLYIATSTPPTFQNGNKVIVFSSTVGWRTIAATLGVSTGKWYWECIGGNSSGHLYNGVCSVEWLQNGDQTSTGPCGETGYNLSQPSAGIYGVNGALTYSNTSGSGNTTGGYSATYVETDYISTYLDLDNHKLYFSKNGTIQNSGTGHDLPTGFTYLPCISIYNSDAAGAGVNFGNGTFFSTALTGTTYSDNDSIGTFKYSPNYGGASTFDGSAKNFMALCTKNIKTYG